MIVRVASYAAMPPQTASIKATIPSSDRRRSRCVPVVVTSRGRTGINAWPFDERLIGREPATAGTFFDMVPPCFTDDAPGLRGAAQRRLLCASTHGAATQICRYGHRRSPRLFLPRLVLYLHPVPARAIPEGGALSPSNTGRATSTVEEAQTTRPQRAG